MNLKQLKLSGFKSFVDPTIVHFPGQLVAVVGPNGCGKSNIIDAVRWVMGESSARNLRGESMTDVIFNGSSSRKAVGQASVELVFDNSLGRLAGPFASYADIAIKRVVTRDGDSSYYLNGTRCRRKDITDIFLGTGAGARGYSIIGQGTISQLIEAKPDDLRVFLEEAAGVSKYKERRKETLQRIAHTRENLTRVTDIRDELDKQLHRLERQAKSAERYLLLKEEVELCRAEILALKWQDFTAQQEVKQRELQDLALSYEQQQSRLAKANIERILLNEKIHAGEEQTQLIQTTYYQLGTEIARLEESIQQNERQKKRLLQEQQQMQADWQGAEEQFTEDKKELLNCQLNAEHLEEQLDQFRKVFKEHEEQYQETQKQKAQWDLRWQEEQKQANNLKREFQVAQINVAHLEQKKQQTFIRLEKIKLEEESISIDALQDAKNELQEEQNKLIRQQQSDVLLLKESQDRASQLAEQVRKTEQVLHEVQDDFHRINSDYAALIAAQRAARQGMQGAKKIIEEWADKPRLMDVLQVDPKWQAACERVLDEALNAYVLETFDELWPKRELCERQGESMVTLKISSETFPLHSCLADKIEGKVPDHVYPLDAIYTAEDFEEALSWLPDLSEHHSIITPDGFWLGKGWVKFAPTGYQDELGLLARQQKIHDLSLVVETLQQKIADLRTQRDYCHNQVQKNLSDLAAQQLNVNASNEALRVNNAALSSNEHALLHAKKLKTNCLLEREELQRAIEEISEEHLLINEGLHCLESKCHDSDLQQEQSMQEQEKFLNALALQSQNFEEARLVLHHAELEYDREKNKMHQLSSRINREQERLNILGERLENLALLCLQTEEPGVALHNQLDLLLLRHTEVELQLTLSKEQGLQLRMELEQLEKNNVDCNLEVRRSQELIAQVRLQEQALEVRATAVQELLNESGLEARALLAHIPEGMKQSVREDDLIALSEKIKRLGAINLAAIDEFSSEQQRKIYLDEQSNDLSQALLTLETAIEKMDKETRVRLENTFAEVNTSFKALFPRLFGGGRAQLELTCENLLEAGIVVMAQPPGKRNSSIHLLSGGEKAMTAVALVFAIFQLNPSPFCMLDEVDAPLDDINVGRFCAMVKEMSQFVQFLFITHNKVTMELADHLMGVTMREPGVSRLVAVDVTQALAME